METFKLKGEYIQLNQLLKVLGWAMSGSEANAIIDDGLVQVNGNTELRRRNKIYSGFKVSFNGETVTVE
ncbi:MAG: RNA-binding S4 domain-containing protein [Chitinophagales bacterium]|nr:RNA-binding S4 domain-containing protein [Chitinophagales bacterium]